jgi:hypothetical protein
VSLTGIVGEIMNAQLATVTIGIPSRIARQTLFTAGWHALPDERTSWCAVH